MVKRQLILKGYRTAEQGLWTLASCIITKAEQVQNFISVPGRFSPLNLSTALTDGEPYYGNATLEAVLESSEGTRAERQARILELTNFFDGRETKIVHPDWPNHYLVGTVQVYPEYNNLVHSRVKLIAVCEPWFYNSAETVKRATLPQEVQGSNLLDIPKATLSGLASYTSLLLGDFELPAGEYSISFNYKHTGDLRGSLSLREYGKLDGYIKEIPLQANTSGKASATFTVPEGVEGIRLYLYSNISATAGATSIEISDIMVNEGSTALPYEPWYQVGDGLIELTNNGRLAVSPMVAVYGEVTLTYNGHTRALSSGTYRLPDLYLTPGKHPVICSGSGTVSFTYREAVLAE